MLGGEENKTQQQVIPLAGRERESQMQLLTSRDRTQLSVKYFCRDIFVLNFGLTREREN